MKNLLLTIFTIVCFTGFSFASMPTNDFTSNNSNTNEENTVGEDWPFCYEWSRTEVYNPLSGQWEVTIVWRCIDIQL